MTIGNGIIWMTTTNGYQFWTVFILPNSADFSFKSLENAIKFALFPIVNCVQHKTSMLPWQQFFHLTHIDKNITSQAAQTAM